MLAVLENCKDDGGGPAISPDDLRFVIPLKAGARWIYREIDHSTQSPVADTMLVYRNVVGVITLPTGALFEIEERKDTMVTGRFEESLTVDRYILSSLSRPSNTQILLERPIVTGHQWFVNGTDTTGGVLRILNADATIRLTHRTYQHAIFIEALTSSSFPKQVYFIVPGVGIVQESGANGSTVYARELVGTNF
jgi:hypothetical protein